MCKINDVARTAILAIVFLQSIAFGLGINGLIYKTSVGVIGLIVGVVVGRNIKISVSD